MKISRFFLMSTLISSLSQTMHIKNSLTIIQFNKEKKALYEWIRDDKNKEFGNTAIITTTTNEPPFTESNYVKTLQPKEFNLIANGFAFYCSNIKKENNITYGAIIINPEQYHFKREVAEIICMTIRNNYVKKQLTDKVELDHHDEKTTNQQKKKTNQQKKT